MANASRSPISLVGGPYAPIGMGEHVRSGYRAMLAAGLEPVILDLEMHTPQHGEQIRKFAHVSDFWASGTNLYFINGDQVRPMLEEADYRGFFERSLWNIVFPAWELAAYPTEWAVQLDRFDEIWAPSLFVKSALEAACEKPVVWMPLACEVSISRFQGRRYFGLPESDYIFLFFFDTRSYASRKNPRGVIEAFRRVLGRRPYARAKLVIKLNGAELRPDVVEALRRELSDLSDHITLIQRVMTDNEVKNLIRCCDCFVSLHRSEGFGRGLAEAMCLGKPVVATGYSGNMDFMNEEVSFVVSYELIPVQEGEYPFGQGQRWADPNVDEAADHMIRLLDEPQLGRQLGFKARMHMAKNFGYAPIGLRYRERLELNASRGAGG